MVTGADSLEILLVYKVRRGTALAGAAASSRGFFFLFLQHTVSGPETRNALGLFFFHRCNTVAAHLISVEMRDL